MPLREGAESGFFRNVLHFLDLESSSDAVLTKQRASGQDHKGGKM